MPTPTDNHIANSLHPKYRSDRADRALSLAFKTGSKAFIQDATSKGKSKWMRPEEGELESIHSPGYRLGMSVFDHRMLSYRTSNDYGDCLNSAAAQPFTYVETFDGWSREVESRLKGDGVGIDGAGSSMRAMHAEAYRSKLFAGIHFIRIDVAGDLPLWVQTEADQLLNWQTSFTKEGRVLSFANVQHEDDRGNLFRTVYKLTSEGVEWVAYKCITEHLVDLRLSTEDYFLASHKLEAIDQGHIKNLWSVPIEPFSMFWSIPYRSPVPFSDAAEIQLGADVSESLLGSFRRRVSSSPAFVISDGDPKAKAGGPGFGRGTDENDQPKPVKTSGGGLRLHSDNAKASWEMLDSNHIQHESAKLESEYLKVRQKCLDPLTSTFKGGQTTATEVAVVDVRSISWLRLSVLADIAPLTRLAQYTSVMSGSSRDGIISITVPASTREKQDIVDRVERQAKDGIVGREVVWKVSSESIEGYPDVEEVRALTLKSESEIPPTVEPKTEPPEDD